jgi:LysM repeat protein
MFRLLLPAVLGVTCIALAACGGGGGDDGGLTNNPHLTDPASVPTSTPISGDQVFQIRDNGISAPTGGSTVPAGDNGNGSSSSGYTIVSGDTCGSIASSLGVSVPELISANPLINEGCTNLQPGQVLAVPGSTGSSGGSGSAIPTPTKAASGNTYVIGAGDTCFDIAANQGVTTDALIAANPDLDCLALQPGQVVDIP